MVFDLRFRTTELTGRRLYVLGVRSFQYRLPWTRGLSMSHGPCADLDVIQIAPEEKQECFVNFIEPENCSRYTLCLVKNDSVSIAVSVNIFIFGMILNALIL